MITIIRGTTPTHRFRFAVNMDSLAAVSITYKQGDRILLKKELDDCSVSGSELSFRLSQRETLRFSAGDGVTVQGRVRYMDNTSWATKPVQMRVADVQEDGEI